MTTSQEHLETRRALAAHLKALEKTLEKHDQRKDTWRDEGLGTWGEARRKLLYRILVVKEMLREE